MNTRIEKLSDIILSVSSIIWLEMTCRDFLSIMVIASYKIPLFPVIIKKS